MNCKITKKNIKPFMSFGKMPLANGFLDENQFNSEYFFEMEVGFSESLSLFQLNDHPGPEKMFNNKNKNISYIYNILIMDDNRSNNL